MPAGKIYKAPRPSTKPRQQRKIKTMAKQVKHLVKLAQNSLSYDDSPLAITSTTAAGTVEYLFDGVSTSLASEPEVLATNQSIKCLYRWMQIRYTVYNGGVTGLTAVTAGCSPCIRVIIFQDWANKQALPAVTDVLLTATVNSPYNALNNKRFSIKYDRTHAINIDNMVRNAADTAFSYASSAQQVNKRIKLARNKTIEYIDSDGGVNDSQKGQLFCLFIDNVTTTGAANHGKITWDSLLCYENM